MKNILFYCLTCLMVTACVKEDRDNCDVRLFFTHNHSVAEFDTEIGNNVQLHVYQDNVLQSTLLIPYSSISGGKDYLLRDYQPGDYTFVAWAVPANESPVATIPETTSGDTYDRQRLELPVNTTAGDFYAPIGNIFLGETAVTVERNKSSRHEVSLTTCITKVWFTVYNAHLLTPEINPGEFWVELEGTSSAMDLQRRAAGEEAVIYQPMTLNSTQQALESGQMGTLPSPADEYLVATLYRNGTRICRVETTERATPGMEIRIEATIGTGVEVFLNNWRVKTATYTYYL